jgi:hypothetical protein
MKRAKLRKNGLISLGCVLSTLLVGGCPPGIQPGGDVGGGIGGGLCASGAGPCTVDEDCDQANNACILKPFSSSFRDDDDGWRVLGGDFASPTRPTWVPFVVTAEGHGDWYWIAPTKFNGDLSTLFGKRLTFEWSTEGGCTDAALFRGMVRATGGGLTLIWGDRPPRSLERTTFSASLEESEAWFVEATDQRATDDDIRSVLGEVERIEIFGQRELCAGSASLYRVAIR